MTDFPYRDQSLHVEAASLADIAARFGTPCYVYSRAAIERQWRAFDAAFGHRAHLVCYAVKANSNIAVVHVLEAALIGAEIATIPFKVIAQLAKHPLTDIGMKQFLADWEKRLK